MVKQASKKSKSFKAFLSSKKNIPMILITIALLILFVFFGVTMVNQGADISRMERQRDEIAVKVDAQVQTNNELQAVLDNEDKDDYIEQKAREKGYVKSNEIVFYDISASE
jgi:cell division protein FtsB